VSIRVNHKGHEYKVLFQYFDEDGERFKKHDNANNPASWHRHPRSCDAVLFKDGVEVGFAASFAHDGENFDRREGRELAFFRLAHLIPYHWVDLRTALLREYQKGRYAPYSTTNENCVPGLNVKGHYIPFRMELDDEA